MFFGRNGKNHQKLSSWEGVSTPLWISDSNTIGKVTMDNMKTVKSAKLSIIITADHKDTEKSAINLKLATGIWKENT